MHGQNSVEWRVDLKLCVGKLMEQSNIENLEAKLTVQSSL